MVTFPYKLPNVIVLFLYAIFTFHFVKLFIAKQNFTLGCFIFKHISSINKYPFLV